MWEKNHKRTAAWLISWRNRHPIRRPVDWPSARAISFLRIFQRIHSIPPAPSGEVYLTDAIAAQISANAMVRAVCLRSGEVRYDIGNHRAYFKTFIDYVPADPEYGAEMRSHMKELLNAPNSVSLDKG